MRWLLFPLSVAVFAGGGSDPVATVAPRKKHSKITRNNSGKPPPESCHAFLRSLSLSELYGVGAFHIQRTKPGPRFLFECEWRVDVGAEVRRTVTYRVACGKQAELFKRFYGRPRAGDVESTLRVGAGGVAWTGPGLAGEPEVRLLVESAAIPGCVVSIRGPGSVKLATRLARAIEDWILTRVGP